MDFTSMDPQTARVAIQLQLADIADLLDSLYGIDEPAQGDERASLETIQSDLSKQLTLLEGQVLVISLLKDEYNERVAFKKLLDDEKQAASDHQLARKLAGMSIGPADAAFSADYGAQLSEEDNCDDDIQWEMAKQLYSSAFEVDHVHPTLEGGPVQPMIATRAPLHDVRTVTAEQAQHQALRSKDLIKCNACMEIVPTQDALRLQCSHTYCRPCLLDLFTSAISNPPLFPPRCCKLPMPLDTCRAMLPKELIKDFDLKIDELATPNPTYCANAECSKFIRPKEIKNDVGTCVFCKDTTCVQCKNQSHTELCPSDPHVQLLMDAAKRSKWQQCTKCNNMVELAQGCFHMTPILTPLAVGASISSAIFAACSGNVALALNGTKTTLPIQPQLQQSQWRYRLGNPLFVELHRLDLTSTIGGDTLKQLVKIAVRIGCRGSCVVPAAILRVAGAAFTTVTKS